MRVGSIRVVSKRKGGVQPAEDEIVIDVDRSNPILGNRFVLHDHRDENERTRVIAAYDVELDEDLSRGGAKSQELDRIAAMVRGGAKVALRCWCKPRRCHADRPAVIIAQRAGIDAASEEGKKGLVWQQQLI